MDFRIADTFTASLARLTGDEQKAIKTTAFDLQLNPANPGMSFHRLDNAKDKNFWSVRVNNDIRIIIHRTDGSLLLCYVDHHDKAYAWAARRKLETHAKTGAAQLVEIRETVKEIVIPAYVPKESAAVAKPVNPKEPLFVNTSDDTLLGYGVPVEWLADVKQATEDTLLTLAEHLPAEAAEALLELATGGKPRITEPTVVAANPFDHPDAQRRFRVVANVDELRQALDFPWDRWLVFLHPDQRGWVQREYTAPARIAGSAGTGKTIVALHRAAWLARAHADARILLTTFSDTLANALQVRLRQLLSAEPRLMERIDVYSINIIGLRLYEARFGAAKLITRKALREIMKEAAGAVGGHKFSLHFLLTEWEQVVDAWQLANWEAYRDVTRLGRKTRLPEAQRTVLWTIYERVRAELKAGGQLTLAGMFSSLATAISGDKKIVFDFVVVDEAQDASVAQLRLFAALGGGRPNALFFAGDLGHRIFQQPFSWKALGVDVRGRSRTLRVNYRTSHQIRTQADRLLSPVVTDVDGNSEERSHTVSVFNGPPPSIQVLDNENAEIDAVAAWILERSQSGVLAQEIGVFVRPEAQLSRAETAVKRAGLKFKILDERVGTTVGQVSIGTMHLAKGLEFRTVVVMAFDDEIIPLQERIEEVGDDADLKEVYDTERHLLYVACTRARDNLLVSAVAPASEFLSDMRGDGGSSAG
ncbi:MAG: DEAD/DEAH box helicase [Phycisphaerales bacterium]|nr:DEAD/DEAH box helicase [Phycisphaerales bacterium]